MFMLSDDAGKVLDLLPFGVVTTDRELLILHINHAARRLLRLSADAKPAGQPVSSVMDETAFLSLRDGDRSTLSDTVRFPDESAVLERTLQCDGEREIIVCTLRDVTQQTRQAEIQLQAALHAVEMAEAINEKHLQAVHDIAGLLGGSAVETQKAVFELKQALLGKENKHA